MELPAWVEELPTWAVVLGALLGALVVVGALSMVLGLVFAGIAVGVELGSPLVGALAVLVGLVIVLVPVVAFVLVSRGSSEEGETDDDPADRVETLREQYVAGEIDEATLERRVDDVLGDGTGGPTPTGAGQSDRIDASRRDHESTTRERDTEERR